MEEKRAYRPLSEKEKDFFRNQIKNLPYIAIVTDERNIIVYLNFLAKEKIKSARIRSNITRATGYIPEEGKLKLCEMYGNTYLVSSVKFTADNRAFYINTLMPDIILASGEYTEYIEDSYENMEKILRDTIFNPADDIHKGNKITRFIKVIAKNYDNNNFARMMLDNFIRDHTMIISSSRRLCNLEMIFDRMIHYAENPLKRMGIELRIVSKCRCVSLVDPKILLYALLCVINFCAMYTDDNVILAELYSKGGINAIRFSTNDKYNALDIYNSFFLNYPGFKTLYSLSYAFAPFAVVNSIMARYKHKVTYNNCYGRSFITIEFDASEGFPERELKDPHYGYNIHIANTPEELIYTYDMMERTRTILDEITKLIHSGKKKGKETFFPPKTDH